MKKSIITLSIFLLSISVFASDFITLDTCYQRLQRNFPLMKNTLIYSQIADLKLKNLKTNYFPQIVLSGQATYQSHVNNFVVNNETYSFQTPDLHHDQYSVATEISQLIYDGGYTNAQKKIADITCKMQQQNVQLDLYDLKQKVNSLYFAILKTQQIADVMEYQRADLQKCMRELEKMVGFEMMTDESLLEIKIANLELEQQLKQTYAEFRSLKLLLSLLTGQEIDEFAEFLIPAPTFEYLHPEQSRYVKTLSNFSINRPEITKLELEKSYMQANYQKLMAASRPKFSAFAQAGYGRPGLNNFSNEFQPFAIAGVRFSWSIINYNFYKRAGAIADFNAQIIANQQESLQSQYILEAQNELDNLYSLEKLRNSDEEIVELRENLSHIKVEQLKKLEIRASEYIKAFNDELLAKIKFEIHNIDYSYAQIKFLQISGISN